MSIYHNNHYFLEMMSKHQMEELNRQVRHRTPIIKKENICRKIFSKLRIFRDIESRAR